MTGQLRAFLWLRWREARQGLRPAGGRDGLEGVSRVLAVLVPVFLALMLLPTAVALGVLGFAAGRLMGLRDTAAIGQGAVLAAIRVLLLLLTATVIFAPAIRSTFGGERGYARFLLLPIRRRLLHILQMLSGLVDPWIAVIVPALLLLPLGLATAGALGAAAVAAVATLGLVFVLLAATSCSSHACAVLFRDRRRGELLTLLIATVLSVSGLVPLLLSNERDFAGSGRAPGSVRIEVPRADESLPGWTYAVPSELYARALVAGVEGRSVGLACAAGLLVWSAGLYALSWRLYRRLLETPETMSTRRGGEGRTFRATRFPGLSVAASAVAWVTIRSVLRTVRGKMAVFMNFLILGAMMAVFGSRPELATPFGQLAGVIFSIAGLAFSLLSLAPVLLNQLAVDGAGLTLQWLSPIATRDVVRGKLAAGAALTGLSSLLCVAMAAILAPRGDLLLWLALLPMFVSSFAVYGPIGTVLSALFPKTADLSRMGKAGNPHDVAVILGLLVTVVALGVPLGAGAFGFFVLDRPAAALLFASVWMLLTLLLFPLLERVAIAASVKRRENLRLVALGR